MRKTMGWAIAACAALVGCATLPAGTSGTPREGAGAYRLLQLESQRLQPVNVWGSSELTWNGTTYGAFRAVDRNTDLEWASSDLDERPTFTLDFGDARTFDRIRIKTWKGSRYRVQVSDDGANWQDATGVLRNRSWAMESKGVGASGRFLRIAFEPPPPEGVSHFAIFEIEAYGRGYGLPPSDGGGGGYASEGLRWLGRTHRIGTYDAQAHADTWNGELALDLWLQRPRTITAMDLYDNNNGRPGGYHWSTRNPSNWLLGVTTDPYGAIGTQRPTLGTYPAGMNRFYLFGATPGTSLDTPGSGVILQVLLDDGTVREFRTNVGR